MGSSSLQYRLVRFFNVSIILFALCAPEAVKAASAIDLDLSTPVGRWKTVDDATGKVTSVVVLWDEHGKLYGKIEKLVNPDPADPAPRCVRCPGDLKDRPLVGLCVWSDAGRVRQDPLMSSASEFPRSDEGAYPALLTFFS